MNTLTTSMRKPIFDEEFENIYVDITIDAFHQLGFSFGDSVDILVDQQYIAQNIPYYSGYYSGVEELMLCGYPGDPYIKIARNCGNPTWHEFQMDQHYEIEVVLHEKEKYKEIEELYSLEYSDDIHDFASQEDFSNFRSLKGGNLKPDTFYRSASPCDNWHHRASYTNELVEKHEIQCVLNLSNSVEKYESFIEKEDFNSFYYDKLYKEGNVLLLLLNVNYRSYEFKKKLADGFREMLKHDKPVLIHCAEGKDRTGFVCATIMALAKANYQDIIDDYMETYHAYYNITKDTQPKKYEAILDNIYDFLYSMCQEEQSTPIEELNLFEGAKQYLKQGDLSDSEINALIAYIEK